MAAPLSGAEFPPWENWSARRRDSARGWFLIGSMIFHTLELVWGRMAVSERRLHIANWTARSVNSIYVEMKHGGQCWQLDQPPGARYVEGVGQDMEQEPMNLILTQHGAELLRAMHDRHPEMTEAAIVEEALAERLGREQGSAPSQPRTPQEIRAWLDELAALSDKIPPRPGETFSREMIYQDHG